MMWNESVSSPVFIFRAWQRSEVRCSVLEPEIQHNKPTTFAAVFWGKCSLKCVYLAYSNCSHKKIVCYFNSDHLILIWRPWSTSCRRMQTRWRRTSLRRNRISTRWVQNDSFCGLQIKARELVTPPVFPPISTPMPLHRCQIRVIWGQIEESVYQCSFSVI